ncbi:MAG TPA: DUF2127 domain-containing protein [Candidatus Babeliales bacterium]|nr:DUF2127 domain-containing protein [Candidatus Babeliales bacterium]
MRLKSKEKYIHRIFIIGVLLKAFDSILEIFAGIALLFKGALTRLAEIGIQNELIQDPHDFVATHLQHWLPAILANSSFFATVYLFCDGGIKMFLVIGLLCNKLWAYPTAIGVFTLFIFYQLYRYTFTYSLILIFLTLIDIIVIALIWHEYQFMKTKITQHIQN